MIKIKTKIPEQKNRDLSSETIKMTMDKYIHDNCESYGRGFTDGLISSILVVGGAVLGVVVSDTIMNRRESGMTKPVQKKK